MSQDVLQRENGCANVFRINCQNNYYSSANYSPADISFLTALTQSHSKQIL